MSDRVVRVVRARDLVKGATVVTECLSVGGEGCAVPADKHMTATEPVAHSRTLLDVEVHDTSVSAICVSESGEQCSLYESEWQMVRVFADSMPQAAPSR